MERQSFESDKSELKLKEKEEQHKVEIKALKVELRNKIEGNKNASKEIKQTLKYVQLRNSLKKVN